MLTATLRNTVAPLRRNALPTLRALSSKLETAPVPVGTPMNASLEETDPELFEVMEREKQRQVRLALGCRQSLVL